MALRGPSGDVHEPHKPGLRLNQELISVYSISVGSSSVDGESFA